MQKKPHTKDAKSAKKASSHLALNSPSSRSLTRVGQPGFLRALCALGVRQPHSRPIAPAEATP